jgi:phytoene dehydrogenase-like protein
MAKRDFVIIGAGHNGLVTAFYLAKAGYKPLVLEARDQVGGCAITSEIAPGFKCSTLSHSSGPIRSDVYRDMRLDQHGLKSVRSDLRVFAPAPDGRALFLYDDAAKSAASIGKLSAKDAKNYQEFQRVIARMSAVMAKLMATAPPSVEHPSTADMMGMLKVGKGIRGLGKKDLYRLLRWGPMAIADLVAEWFDTELLRATIAARGIFGTFLGPWSAGSSTVFLMRAAADSNLAGPANSAIGGIGALTEAMAAAARAAGVEIRLNAPVAQINAKDGIVSGVTLATGEVIEAKAVISNADPKLTLLGLLDPSNLEPDFLMKLQNFRANGTVAKVNLALSGLPKFTAQNGDGSGVNSLGGRIHIGPEIDYLERAYDDAKYGDFSRQPYLDVTIPSLADDSLAPHGAHVMSIYAQFAPYALREGDWASRREELGDAIVNTLAAYAPDLKGLVVARQVLTPLDLEETYGLTGGHALHGEPSLDQFFTFRPLIGWAQYRTPVDGLYLCGAGTHPGGGVTGGPGANASREILKDLKNGRRS